MSNLVFTKTMNKLAWGTFTYKAVSGGFGKGPLPNGDYDVKIRNVVVNPPESGFKDEITGKSWFIPISPTFPSSRSGFGIHPDGSPKGTKGCIGLQGADTEKFWGKWLQTPLSQRPTSLKVI
jgi:L,D-transpeptidase catalytic domain